MKIDKTLTINGAGASVGVVWTVLSKNYIDTTFGAIPWLGTVLPYPWGNWSTGGSIIIGGVLFGLSQFTNLIRNYTLNSFLKYFGLTALIGGLMNGLLYGAAPAARMRGLRLARAGGPISNLTPTGIPTAKILA